MLRVVHLALLLILTNGQQMSQFESNLKTFIQSVAKCHHIPVLSLSIISQNESPLVEMVYSEETNVNQSPPVVTERTLICQGSLTKPLSALLMVRLAEEGHFSLDQSVASILKRPFFTNEPGLDSLTIREILSQATPIISNHVMSFFGFPYENFTDVAEHLKHSKSKPNHRGSAGNEWNYSNALYSLTGFIVEQIFQGQISWFDLMKRLVLRPIGMVDAKFTAELSGRSQNVAMSSVRLGHMTHPISLSRLRSIANAVSPAMGLCASTRDMTKFLQFLSSGDGRSVTGNRIVSQSAFEDLFTVNTPIRSIPPINAADGSPQITTHGYGLGWMLGRYRGHPRFYHNGFLYGYQSTVWLVPGLQVAIYVGFTGSDLLASKDLILTVLMDQLISELRYLGSLATTISHPCQLAAKRLPAARLRPQCSQCPVFMADAESSIQTGFDRSEKKSITGLYSNPVLGDIRIEPLNSDIKTRKETWSISFGNLGKGVLCPVAESNNWDGEVKFEVQITDPVLVLYFPNCDLCGLRASKFEFCQNLLTFVENMDGFNFNMMDYSSPPFFQKHL